MQTRLTDPHRQPCQTPDMELSKMTRQEIEALLRLLAACERRTYATCSSTIL